MVHVQKALKMVGCGTRRSGMYILVDNATDRVVVGPYSLSDAQNNMCKVVWWLNVSKQHVQGCLVVKCLLNLVHQ